jgi:hypothetical protein
MALLRYAGVLVPVVLLAFCGGESDETSIPTGGGGHGVGAGGSGANGGVGAGGATGGSGGSVTPPPGCGNDVAEMGEACDGADLAGQSCASLPGYASGALGCAPSCLAFDASGCVAGAQIAAASCEHDAVQAAVDQAAEGDIVMVPAGNCTWNASVDVSKSLLIVGAGQDQTVITAGDADPFSIQGAGGAVRVSGFGFTGNAPFAYLVFDGEYSNVRVDHCRFDGILGTRGVMLNYQRQGAFPALFDHLSISVADWKIFLAVYGMNDSWNQPDDFGTARYVYLEDVDFQGVGIATDLVDGECGARFVVRHSVLLNGMVMFHDTGSTPGCRSTRLVEVYDNDFSCDLENCGWTAMSFRGGSGVFYDNVIARNPGGYDDGAATQLWRSYDVGGAPFDSLCDDVPDRICSDMSSHCDAGDRGPCGGDWDCSVGSCTVSACTTNDQCGSSGATCLEKLDGHQDSSGWPCRDQTGRGIDDPVTHEQASLPAYWWNNLDPNGSAMNVLINDHGLPTFPFIIEGRDFIYGARPGYAPYPYPHPLTGLEPLP